MKAKDNIAQLKGRGKLHMSDIHSRNVCRLSLFSAYQTGMSCLKENPHWRNKTVYTHLTLAKRILDNPVGHSNSTMREVEQDIYHEVTLLLERGK